jgi:hypothetical protein
LTTRARIGPGCDEVTLESSLQKIVERARDGAE